MAYTIVIHINDEDPVIGETDELPLLTDMLVKVSNPRRLDNKDLHYLTIGVVEIYWPIARINFIEVMPTDEDEIIGFVRE